jgi:acyl carrier protein
MTSSLPDLDTRISAVVLRVSRTAGPIDRSTELVADLGLDSMHLLELIAELEDEFGIYIPLNEVPAIKTFGQVVDRVGGLVREQGRA